MSPRGLVAAACAAALALAGLRSPATPARPERTSLVPAPVAARAIPAAAWQGVRRIELPALCATPAVALRDDTLAVGLEARPGVAFVAREGQVITTARVDSRIAQPLAAGGDRVLVVAGLRVLVVSPDGVVRNAPSFDMPPRAPPVQRPDGTFVVVGAQAGGRGELIELSALTPEGDLAARRTSTLAMLTAPALLSDGRVAVGTSSTLEVIDADNRLSRIPVVPGLRHVASRADGSMAMATSANLLLADTQGVVRARAPLPAAPTWIAALSGGRVAVATVTPELLVFQRDGSLASRTQIPHDTAAPCEDPSGALLLASRGGEVIAVERDGAERWRVSLHELVRPPAVLLGRGGAAISTESNALLLLTDSP